MNKDKQIRVSDKRTTKLLDTNILSLCYLDALLIIFYRILLETNTQRKLIKSSNNILKYNKK